VEDRLRKIFAAILILVIVGIVASAPLIPYSPKSPNFGDEFQRPSWRHWLGTDQFGRDVLSRLVWGSQISLISAALSTVIAVSLGVIIGAASAGVGGYLDWLLMRGIDILLAVPGILLAMLLVATFGRGYLEISLGVGISLSPAFSRLVRATLRSIRHAPYIQASEALGATTTRVIFFHLIPNAVPQIASFSAILFSWAILDIAGLEFLGLAGSPDNVSWGRLLNEGRTYMLDAPWIALSAGAAITLTILSLLTVGRTFREV